ncbi:hypothetical protein M9458_053164, partial [Cirrhinus mrigala]
PVHTTRDTQRQSDAIPFISMESWRFPATRATAAVSDRMWASESLNFMQMKSDFRERQPIGKKTIVLISDGGEINSCR